MAPGKFRDLILQSAERMITRFPSNHSVKETHVTKPPKTEKSKKREASRVPEADQRAKRPRTRADHRQRVDLDEVVHPSAVKPSTSTEPIQLPRSDSAIPLSTITMPVNPLNQGIRNISSGAEARIEVLPEKHGLETDFPEPKSNVEGAGFPLVTTATINANLAPGGMDKASENSDDSYDDTGSVFEEFLETTPDILQGGKHLPTISAPVHCMTTPKKTGILPRGNENLKMLQVSSSQTSSPTSAKVLRSSSPMKPFIRQLPLSKVPKMSINLPWLKADHQIITCFRTAEVIRIQSQPQPIAVSNDHGRTIELYARIKSTVHQDTGSMVQFVDLFFPSRPPYLIGACMTDEASAAVARIMSTSASPKAPFTQGSQSTEYSSIYELCRAIIRTKLGSKEVSIQSVRETSWEEVEHVRGIVEPNYQVR